MKRAKWSKLYKDVEGNKCIRIHNPKCGGEFQDRPCDPTFWDKVMEMRDFNDRILNRGQVIMREYFAQSSKNGCDKKGQYAVHSIRKYCRNPWKRSTEV